MDISEKTKKWSKVIVSVLIVVVGINGMLKVTFSDLGIDFSSEFYISILLIFLGITIPYLIAAIEKNTVSVNSISDLSKAELIKSQESLFDNLLNESILSDEIYTHMLSDPPRKINQNAVDYFDRIHKKVMDGSIKKFSRIASVNTKEKATWILDTLLELKDTPSFSLAIKYVDHNSPLATIHLCVKESDPTVFVWPTVVPGGQGKAFFVKNKFIVDGMKSEHQREFDHSIKLKYGPVIDYENLEHLATEYELKKHKSYIALCK